MLGPHRRSAERARVVGSRAALQGTHQLAHADSLVPAGRDQLQRAVQRLRVQPVAGRLEDLVVQRRALQLRRLQHQLVAAVLLLEVVLGLRLRLVVRVLRRVQPQLQHVLPDALDRQRLLPGELRALPQRDGHPHPHGHADGHAIVYEHAQPLGVELADAQRHAVELADAQRHAV